MFTFTESVRVYLAVEPCDLRKSFNGLHAVARNQLQEDPLSGALFVFINRQGNRLKILYWDGTGLWVWAKRLERGKFSWPQSAQGKKKLNLHPQALSLLINGIDLKEGCKKAWYER